MISARLVSGLATVLSLTLAATACREQQRDRAEGGRAAAEEAGRALDALAAANRAAYHRLPSCPGTPVAALTIDPTWVLVPERIARLPAEYRRDSIGDRGYIHGGRHYRAGPRVVKIVWGHYGWSSFTQHPEGIGEIQGGCRARVGAREYLVERRGTDAAGYTATAMPVMDTLELRGHATYTVVAPEPPLELLLQILAALPTPAG